MKSIMRALLVLVSLGAVGCGTASRSSVPTPEEFCRDKGGVSYVQSEEVYNVIFCENGEHIHVPE